MPALGRRRRGFVNHVEATLQADKIMPLQVILFRDLHKRFGALPRTAHELFLGRGGVANATVYFEANEFELGTGRKTGGENFQGLLDSFELRAAFTANGDDDFGHSSGNFVVIVTVFEQEFHGEFLGPEENSEAEADRDKGEYAEGKCFRLNV